MAAHPMPRGPANTQFRKVVLEYCTTSHSASILFRQNNNSWKIIITTTLETAYQLCRLFSHFARGIISRGGGRLCYSLLSLLLQFQHGALSCWSKNSAENIKNYVRTTVRTYNCMTSMLFLAFFIFVFDF
jgi:hypothetical protein